MTARINHSSGRAVVFERLLSVAGWMNQQQQQRCSLLHTNLSICLSLFLSVHLSLCSFSSSRSTVRRLLKRISHDCLTVILRDPLRSIQVSLSASICVIACLLFLTALTNREGWWILIVGAPACSFSISFSSVFCNILITLRSAGLSPLTFAWVRKSK